MAKRGRMKLVAAAWAQALVVALLVVWTLAGCSCAPAASVLDTSDEDPRSSSVAAVELAGTQAVELEENSSLADPPADASDSSTPASNDSSSAAQSAQTVAPITDQLKVRFIDVGQGDCALLTCGGQSLLIDGGPSEASSKLYSILKTLGIDYLDYIVCTHPDEDHCGGISGALNYAKCGTFFCSVTNHDTATFAHLLNYLGDVPVTVPALGQQFSLGQATVEFVGPAERTRDSNEGSLVCRVDLGEVSFLFTGDAGEESERAMVGSGQNVDVDVLKVGHHGSAGATSNRFLQAVTPDYAVISVGSGNSYGHPTEEALSRLAATGATVLRTDLQGSIVFTTDGSSVSIETISGQITE